MANEPRIQLALVSEMPETPVRGVLYISPDVSGNFIKVGIDGSVRTIFDGSIYTLKKDSPWVTGDGISSATLKNTNNSAIGYNSVAHGAQATAIGDNSHAEGERTVAYGYNSHAEGRYVTSYGQYSHVEGYIYAPQSSYTISGSANTTTYTSSANHTLSVDNLVRYNNIVAKVIAVVDNTTFTLDKTLDNKNALSSEKIFIIKGGAIGDYSHAEGNGTTASGTYSHAEGINTTASGQASHAEGNGTTASGAQSHAEGSGTTTSGAYSHAEGSSTTTLGAQSHAEGSGTTASGTCSHAEGGSTTASGTYSHAEGNSTISYGNYSHTEGFNQYVQSTYNVSGIANTSTYTTSTNHNLTPGILVKYKKVVAKVVSVDSNTSFTLDKTLDATTALSSVKIYFSKGGAVGNNSHTEGYLTYTLDDYSHAEGANTTASGNAAHAEGNNTTASGAQSHAEGDGTTASGIAAHAEGNNTIALGDYSHAEGKDTYTYGLQSHAEGSTTYTYGENSHTEGTTTYAYGNYSHAEGFNQNTKASYTISGAANTSVYTTSANHNLVVDNLIKYNNIIAKVISVDTSTTFTLDKTLDASNALSSAEIYNIKGAAIGGASHTEGGNTTALGNYSHAEGNGTTAKGMSSHAEGLNTTASGAYSHAEGNGTTASTSYAHAEGTNTTASGTASHSEGTNTTASGTYSHAEGRNTTASGNYSHAEGTNTTASGEHSHAEGVNTDASGAYSHAEGRNTQALNVYEHAQGQFNKSNMYNTTFGNAGNTLFSIGVGANNPTRKNAIEVMQSGDVYIKEINGYNGTNPSAEKSLQSKISAIDTSLSILSNILNVSTADNGKVVMVVNGQLALVTLS